MKPLDYAIAHEIVQSTVLKLGGLGAYPQGNFAKIRLLPGIEFCSNFDYKNLPTDGLSNT